MNYYEPTTIEDAVKLLSENDDARCLAGGASLVAMMNAELVMPDVLVSLRNIEALKGVQRLDDGAVRVGAMTSHAAVEAHDGFMGGQEIMRQAAAEIGHPAIRNMGTIGGSISHADPAADYPSALVAADAEVEIAGPGGTRTTPAEAFFVDFLETALMDGELVTAVRVPKAPDGSASAYVKLARVDGDFATVAASAVISWDGARCGYARLAVGACGPTPVRVDEADRALIGTTLDDDAIARAGAILADACDPIDDMRGSAQYRLTVAPRLVRRAILEAKANAEARP